MVGYSLQEDMYLKQLLAEYGPRWQKITHAFMIRFDKDYTQSMLRNRFQRMKSRKRTRGNVCGRCGQNVAGHSCPYKIPPPLKGKCDTTDNTTSNFECDKDSAYDTDFDSASENEVAHENEVDFTVVEQEQVTKEVNTDPDTIHWSFGADTDLDIKDLKMSPWNMDNWSNSTTSFVSLPVLKFA